MTSSEIGVLRNGYDTVTRRNINDPPVMQLNQLEQYRRQQEEFRRYDNWTKWKKILRPIIQTTEEERARPRAIIVLNDNHNNNHQ